MISRRLSEFSREELEGLITKSNAHIQRLEGMKQEEAYKNSVSAIEGFNLQIQSEKENIGMYQGILEKKH